MVEAEFNDAFLNLCEKHISQAKLLVNKPNLFKEELIKLNELLENNWSSIYNEETTSSMTILQKRKILNFIEEIKSLEEIAKSLGTWLDGFEDFMENFSKKNN